MALLLLLLLHSLSNINANNNNSHADALHSCFDALPTRPPQSSPAQAVSAFIAPGRIRPCTCTTRTNIQALVPSASVLVWTSLCHSACGVSFLLSSSCASHLTVAYLILTHLIGQNPLPELVPEPVPEPVPVPVPPPYAALSCH